MILDINILTDKAITLIYLLIRIFCTWNFPKASLCLYELLWHRILRASPSKPHLISFQNLAYVLSPGSSDWHLRFRLTRLRGLNLLSKISVTTKVVLVLDLDLFCKQMTEDPTILVFVHIPQIYISIPKFSSATLHIFDCINLLL